MKYINFTTGKLCKQKGIVWEIIKFLPKKDSNNSLVFETEITPGVIPTTPYGYACYNEEGHTIMPKRFSIKNSHYPRFFQSELQKVLREKYSIHVWCVPRIGNSYGAYVQDYNISGMLSCDLKDSYENALEEGLVKALNLLPDLK